MRYAVLLATVALGLGCSYIADQSNQKQEIVSTAGSTPAAIVRDAQRVPEPEVPDESRIPSWPPVLDQPYPDLRLQDHTGAWVSLSDFKGKVLLIEPVGMPCQGCIAMAGGRDPKIGPFAGIPPQSNFPSVKEMLSGYSDVTLDQAGLVYIQILLYNLDMGPPTAKDAAAWQAHFTPYATPNTVVLAGHPHLIGQDSYNMIPGLQLVDRDFILRYWVSNYGPHGHHDLLSSILPFIRAKRT